MLEWLGIQRFAYDYRDEHIPTFDEEMVMLKKYNIRLLAWWFPTVLNDEARLILEVLRRHKLQGVQLWVTGSGAAPKSTAEQQMMVASEAARIRSIAEAASKQGCTVGLYNHGGWFGDPDNQIAIIEHLKGQGATNVGIVYNLHHGHEHIDRFPDIMRKMKPYLLAINLNGMTRDADKTGKKILPLGQGDLDLWILKVICESGWQGPVGILNHTDQDAEARLQDNVEGLDWLVAQLLGRPVGPKPKPKTWPEAAAPTGQSSLGPAFDKALSGGMVMDGQPQYRSMPLTIEFWAKLNSARNFNILVACDPKSSADHWELYSYADSGLFSAYLPGRGGEFKSNVNICNGQWQYLAAIFESTRVRLFVNGELVLDRAANPRSGEPHPGGLAFGRLVEGGIGCDGLIDEVRISRGVRPIGGIPTAPFEADSETLGLWHFDNL